MSPEFLKKFATDMASQERGQRETGADRKELYKRFWNFMDFFVASVDSMARFTAHVVLLALGAGFAVSLCSCFCETFHRNSASHTQGSFHVESIGITEQAIGCLSSSSNVSWESRAVKVSYLYDFCAFKCLPEFEKPNV
jgi:hypothetical protein